MKLRLKTVLAGAVALALAGGLVAVGGGIASAATTPPYEPDAGATGSLSFYDASGNVITSGSTTAHPFANFIASSVPGLAGNTKATLFAYTPKNGVPIGAWSGEQMTGSTTFPNAAAPAPLNGFTNPVVSSAAADFSVDDYIGDFPNTAVDSYQGLYQLRLKTSGPSGFDSAYAEASILVTGTTWTQVWPAVKVGTTTTITASPASPAAHNTSVTFTANVAAGDATHPAGAVEFFDGATDIGAGSFNAATGVATKALVPADGAHSFKAVFTPTDTTTYNGSTSSVLSYTVNPAGPAAPTTTALTVNPLTGATNTNVILHANVTKTSDSSVVTAGSIKFFDGAAQIATGTPGVDQTVSFSTVGTHTITAQFVPTDATVYVGSTSAGIDFVATAPTFAPDPQTVEATVGAGTMTITTPYGPSNPLNLGALVLSTDGTQLAVSAPFGVLGADPLAANYLDATIKITDSRSGNLGWNASVISTDFVKDASNSISSQNVGLINLLSNYPAGNALAGHVTTTDNPGSAVAVAAGAPGNAGLKTAKVFATAPVGNSVGTVGITGTMTLVAPTSTAAGLYVATVTFTVA